MHRTVVEESVQNLTVMDVYTKLIQNRIVFIDDEIDSELANTIIGQLMYLDSINNEEIKVYINSPGGTVVQGLAIYDIAKTLKSPITTICMGEAASMGAILMLIGSTRKGLKHSRFMLHQISGFLGGGLDKMISYTKEAEVLQEILKGILRENLTIDNVDEYMKVDKWFGSEEAIKIGFLTDIVQ